jgi:hypothetical protein
MLSFGPAFRCKSATKALHIPSAGFTLQSGVKAQLKNLSELKSRSSIKIA